MLLPLLQQKDSGMMKIKVYLLSKSCRVSISPAASSGARHVDMHSSPKGIFMCNKIGVTAVGTELMFGHTTLCVMHASLLCLFII